jgi:hypothetical protein
MADLFTFASESARVAFRPPTRNVFDIDPVTYAAQRIAECTQDLVDRALASNDMTGVLRIEALTAPLIAQLTALSATALRRAVQLSHQEGR